MSTPFELRWQNIEGLSIPLLAYADEDWIPVDELAASLGVQKNRLIRAAMSPANHGLVVAATLMADPVSRRLCVTRTTLLHLAHRIRPGTNNQLLRFIQCAASISTPINDARWRRADAARYRALVRREREAAKSERLQQRSSLLARLITEFDAGRPLRDLEAEWIQRTKLSPLTLHKALRGSGAGKALAAAHQSLGIERTHRKVQSGDRRPGRPPKITQDVIQGIQHQAAEGHSTKDLARSFKLSTATVKAIVKGTYWTSAAKENAASTGVHIG